MALADFCKPPEIKTIKTDNYQGNKGDFITIRAPDNFGITALKVFISSPDGPLVESGLAIKAPNGSDWIYTSTAGSGSPAVYLEIKIQASDTAGNVTEFEQTITI